MSHRARPSAAAGGATSTDLTGEPDVVVRWDELDRLFREINDRRIAEWIPVTSSRYALNAEFSGGRLDEGRRIATFLRERLGHEDLTVLDLGAGNGGVAIGLANVSGLNVATIDLGPNRTFREVVRRTGLSVRETIGDARALPFRGASFDACVCLDTLEHIPRAEDLGREVMRVLKPGGLIMLTTPPRLRYLLRRDPHFDIWGLLALPEGLQRLVATRLLKRAVVVGGEGENIVSYDVHRTYWHVNQIASLFPEPRETEVTWDNPFPGRTRIQRSIWYRLRNLLWHRIVIKKPEAQLDSTGSS